MVPAVRSQNQQDERILGSVCYFATDQPAGSQASSVQLCPLSICCINLYQTLVSCAWLLHAMYLLYDLYPIFGVHHISDEAAHNAAGSAGSVNDRQG